MSHPVARRELIESNLAGFRRLESLNWPVHDDRIVLYEWFENLEDSRKSCATILPIMNLSIKKKV